MIGTLMGMCVLGMFLVGVLIPLGILIYVVVVAIEDQIWNKQSLYLQMTKSLRNSEFSELCSLLKSLHFFVKYLRNRVFIDEVEKVLNVI